jgi:hypothetical protein
MGELITLYGSHRTPEKITLYGKHRTPEKIYLLVCDLDARPHNRQFCLEIGILESRVSCSLSSYCEIHNKDLNEFDAAELAADEYCVECPRKWKFSVAESSLTSGELSSDWQCLSEAQELVHQFVATKVTHNGLHRTEVRALFDSPWTTRRPMELRIYQFRKESGSRSL